MRTVWEATDWRCSRRLHPFLPELVPVLEQHGHLVVPAAYWGERVRAVVVTRAGHHVSEEELMEHCHQRLASFKKPESVVFVSELPHNPMGKVLKRVLREEYGGESTAGRSPQPNNVNYLLPDGIPMPESLEGDCQGATNSLPLGKQLG